MWDAPRLAVFQTWAPMPFAARDCDLYCGCPHFHFEHIPLIDPHFSGFLKNVGAVVCYWASKYQGRSTTCADRGHPPRPSSAWAGACLETGRWERFRLAPLAVVSFQSSVVSNDQTWQIRYRMPPLAVRQF